MLPGMRITPRRRRMTFACETCARELRLNMLGRLATDEPRPICEYGTHRAEFLIRTETRTFRQVMADVEQDRRGR